MLWLRISMILSMTTLVMGMAGCGTEVPLYRASANASIHDAAFRGSGIKPGVILAWHHQLYELVDTVQADRVGRPLGDVRYHGALDMGLSLYSLVSAGRKW